MIDYEELKPIAGFESFGYVNRKGEFFKPDMTPKKLFRHVNKKGKQARYLINFYKTREVSTNKTAANLVAKTFIPNPFNLECVKIKDGDHTNLCVDNLEWISKSELSKFYATGKGGRHMRKLTDEQVRKIKKSCVPNHPHYGIKAFADRYNVDTRTVFGIVHGLLYKDV